jgi:hypothetical protein
VQCEILPILMQKAHMCRGWHRPWPGLRRHGRLQPLIRLCCALWQVTLLLL